MDDYLPAYKRTCKNSTIAPVVSRFATKVKRRPVTRESARKPSRSRLVAPVQKREDFVFFPATGCPLNSFPREQIVEAEQLRPCRQSGAVDAHRVEIPPGERTREGVF